VGVQAASKHVRCMMDSNLGWEGGGASVLAALWSDSLLVPLPPPLSLSPSICVACFVFHADVCRYYQEKLGVPPAEQGQAVRDMVKVRSNTLGVLGGRARLRAHHCMPRVLAPV
jgi:hypothetical protein